MTKKEKAKRLKQVEIEAKERKRTLGTRFVQTKAQTVMETTPDIAVLTQCFDNMREELDRARRNGDFWRRMAFDLLTRSPLESETWLKGRTAASAQATSYSPTQTPTQ